MLNRLLLAVLLVTGSLAVSAGSQVAKQQELVAMLEQIINRHLGVNGYEIKTVDSDRAFIVQIFYPETYSERILGQSGIFLRSLKILFNDLYLQAQKLDDKAFELENAKKMHLRFIAKK